MTARSLAALGLLAAVAATSACTDNTAGGGGSGGASGGRVQVTSSAQECTLSQTSLPSGNAVFSIRNTGSKVTEFYLLAADGLRVVGEVENIAPGLTRDLVVQVPPGRYRTACKPGMVGQGIRAPFTVTDSGVDLAPSGDRKRLADAASRQYSGYVRDQVSQLLAKTTRFADLYRSGQDDGARALYADARLHWERVEPVAESFGDLDPKMDLREADLEPGQTWTGWHRIEKDLWPPASGHTALTPPQRAQVAGQLVRDTRTLYDRTRTGTHTPTQIANGAKTLLDEVASGKVTGEEEVWSHTDLWDFQGNVDGAKVAFESLRPLLREKDRALESSIATKFTALQKLLDQHREGQGFVGYDTLAPAQVKELSNAVNALSEPLSRMSAAVTL